MPVLVIGGHTRSVGKTSVVAGLIAALPGFHWTALKITQYGHGVCSANGAPCDCATADHSFAVSEEKDRSGESDTSRFLVAGADHYSKSSAWKQVSLKPVIDRPMFAIHPPNYVTPEVIEFVRERLFRFSQTSRPNNSLSS